MVDRKQAVMEFLRFIESIQTGIPQNWGFRLKLKSGDELVFKVAVARRPSLRLVDRG